MNHRRPRSPSPVALASLTRETSRVLAASWALVVVMLSPTWAWAQDASIDPGVFSAFLDFERLVLSFFIIGTAWLLSRVTSATLNNIGERIATRRLLIKKITSLTRFMIYLVAAMVIVFGVVRPERNTLLALATALSLVIGLSLQDLIGSIIAGVIILIDTPFQVGDRVRFGEVYGEVTEIGLRTVRITDLDDNVISIPNNKFLTEVVSSGNAGALDMMVVIDFHIGVAENYALAKRLAFEGGITSKYTFLEKPVAVYVFNVSTPAGFAKRIRVKLYVIDVRYEQEILTDITERVGAAFAHHKIRPPYQDWRSVQLHPILPQAPVVRTAASVSLPDVAGGARRSPKAPHPIHPVPVTLAEVLSARPIPQVLPVVTEARGPSKAAGLEGGASEDGSPEAVSELLMSPSPEVLTAVSSIDERADPSAIQTEPDAADGGEGAAPAQLKGDATGSSSKDSSHDVDLEVGEASSSDDSEG